MTRPVIGVVAGAALGLIDGMSAWFYPEARSMMLTIILGSTVKGVLTGLSVGLVAKWKQSLPLGILAGALVGFALSSLVAMGQPAQYWEIVLPGMLVGVIAGVICQRWRVAAVALSCVLAASSLVGASQAPTASRLKVVQPFVGNWQGTSEGQPGTGTLTREYRLVLRDRFIEETTAKALSINTFSSRQQNQACSSSSVKPSRTFQKGYRARETYTYINESEFEEVFEMAEPGKDFVLYSKARLKRIP